MYAKLINNVLEAAPESIVKNNIGYQNYHLQSNAKMLLEDGYKPVEECNAPTEMLLPQKYFIETEDKIIATYTETYVEPDYSSKRINDYPDGREYLDAIVKINSGDENLALQGQIQLDNYYRLCLETKNKYPKQ